MKFAYVLRRLGFLMISKVHLSEQCIFQGGVAITSFSFFGIPIKLGTRPCTQFRVDISRVVFHVLI